MNINNPTTFSAPDLTLSTSNSSGSAGALRADDTILVYDTTLPANVTTGSAATGSASTSARRDHQHSDGGAFGDVFGPGSSVDHALARFSGTTGKTIQAWTSNSPVGTDAGILSFPGQPAFNYELSAEDLNVTGGGSVYTLGDGNALTEHFDQSGEVTTGGVFTPTVGGIYLLGCQLVFNNVSAGSLMDNFALRIVTTGDTESHFGNLLNNAASTSFLGVGSIGFVALFEMAASETAKVTLQVWDATDVLDIEAGNTRFFGYKVA